MIESNKETETSLRDRVLEIIDKGKEGDRHSQWCDYFLSGLIVLNLVSICLESVASIYDAYSQEFFVFEILSLAIFLTEYLFRVWVAASKSENGNTNLKRRLKYILSPTGIIDLIAILPGLLQFFGFMLDLRWIRIIRLVRLLKMSHYSPAFQDLFDVLREERSALGATMYLLFVAIFFSSACLYVLEGDIQDAFVSIPESMWWAVVTLTTVGYGDVAPVTPFGKLLGAITAIIGVLTVAMMTGIVSSAFSTKMASKKEALKNEIIEAMSDGIVSAEEMSEIERMAKAMHLSDTELEVLMRYEQHKVKKD